MSGETGGPVLVAISGMAVADGFSLLVLASVAACLAISVRELCEFPRAAFALSVVARRELLKKYYIFTTCSFLRVPNLKRGSCK